METLIWKILGVWVADDMSFVFSIKCMIAFCLFCHESAASVNAFL